MFPKWLDQTAMVVLGFWFGYYLAMTIHNTYLLITKGRK